MSHFLKRFFLFLASFPMSGYWRSKLVFAAGAKYTPIADDHHYEVFIGKNVHIDSIHPENIEIGNWTTIAAGCVILTHYLRPGVAPFPFFHHEVGYVRIGRGVFIGCNSVICKPVTIGDGSIVAAGSVVLHDIPPMEIWGGNPARFIKKRSDNVKIEENHPMTNIKNVP